MIDQAFKHIAVTQRNGTVIASFVSDRLSDDAIIQTIGQELFRLSDTDEPRLIISFKYVRYMSSAMVGKLLAVKRRVTKSNGVLALTDLSAACHEVLAIAKLDSFFVIYPTVDEAVAAIS